MLTPHTTHHQGTTLSAQRLRPPDPHLEAITVTTRAVQEPQDPHLDTQDTLLEMPTGILPEARSRPDIILAATTRLPM